jgi:hypothetical protein
MTKLFRPITAMILALVIMMAGCKPTKEYANLAKAGTTYATALDALLVATGNIELDATSEKLVQISSRSRLSLADYQSVSVEDEKLLKIITDLRKHVKLLSRYFGLLYELATSDAPDRAKAAIGDGSSGVIANLNAVGNELRGSSLVPQNVASAAGPLTGLVVSGIIRGALRDELKARQVTIQRELILQEKLLEALSKRITRDLNNTQETREKRLVIEPITSGKPLDKPDEWVANRRLILTMTLTADQLSTASDSVKKLREAFEALLSGKLTLDRVDALVSDFDSLLTIAEKLKGKS